MPVAESPEIQELKAKIWTLETELSTAQQMAGTRTIKKDAGAWDRLENIGRKIGKDWKSKKTSWEIISESRR